MRADRSSTRRWLVGVIGATAVAGAIWAAAGTSLGAWMSTGRERADEKRARRGGVSVTAAGAPGERVGVTLAAGRPLVLRIQRAPRGSAVRIALTEGADVTVHAPTGQTTFTADSVDLTIDLHAAATIDVAVPRNAAYVEIAHAGLRLFLKDGADVATEVAPDSTGAHLLHLDAASAALPAPAREPR